MNSNSFPVLRNRVSFAIRCRMPSEGRSFIDRRTRRVEASDAKTLFRTDAGVLNPSFTANTVQKVAEQRELPGVCQ